MKCTKCGQELDVSGRCPYCSPEPPEVRVMSKEEKNLYNGITIDENIENTAQHRENRTYTKRQDKSNIFFKNIRFNTFGSNWMSRAAVFLLIAAGLGFVVFIALPIALIGVAIGVIVWFLLSFLRH